ncbi:MAG: hypothetical protein ONB25_12545 [candidate division KSB1 bacterium]|nr:hypothetical protein [candidate division KSB1 bacterium]
MRVIPVFLAVAIMGTGATMCPSNAQERQRVIQQQKNVIAINPVGIAFGIENVEFERALTERTGMALYWARTGFTPGKIGGREFAGSEERVTYRRYFSRRAPRGSWVGVSLAYSSGDVWSESADVYNLSMLALSLEVGYRATGGGFNIAPIAMLRFTLTDNLLGQKFTCGGTVKYPLAGPGLGILVGWGW